MAQNHNPLVLGDRTGYPDRILESPFPVSKYRGIGSRRPIKNPRADCASDVKIKIKMERITNMKRLLALLLVLVLVAASTAPAFAAGGSSSQAGKAGPGQGDHGSPNGNGNGAGQSASQAQKAKHFTPPTGDQTDGTGKAKGKATRAGDPKGPSPMARSAFVLGGTVSAVDTISTTVTITVYHGNRAGHGFYGEPITLTVGSSTNLMMWTPTGVVSATLADLTSGQNIMVKGRMVDGVWTVSRVMIGLGLARMPQDEARKTNDQ